MCCTSQVITVCGARSLFELISHAGRPAQRSVFEIALLNTHDQLCSAVMDTFTHWTGMMLRVKAFTEVDWILV